MADAGRVIAGSAKGIRLIAPGDGTRPLGDRVKEALFGTLQPRLPGSRFLDLYAGAGAAGVEALSRGADLAVFVERDRGAAAAIAENLRRAGFGPPGARVVRAPVLSYLASGATQDGPFDVVFADPPYADVEALERTMALLGGPSGSGILAPGAIIVAKHFWRHPPATRIGLLASVRGRRFGETALTYYEHGEGAEAP